MPLGLRSSSRSLLSSITSNSGGGKGRTNRRRNYNNGNGNGGERGNDSLVSIIINPSEMAIVNHNKRIHYHNNNNNNNNNKPMTAGNLISSVTTKAGYWGSAVI